MKKVSDLQFYGFVELYRILKQKFSDFHLSDLYWDAGWFSISKVPYDDTEEGEIILEIVNPIPDEATIEQIEKLIDTENRKIEIRFFVHSADSICFEVEQNDFDNSEFIDELKKIIGKIVPARKNSETWSKDVVVLAKEIIKNSRVSNYLNEEIPST